ncbi:MAG: hypothetical protein DRP65_00035 [Planctomycetota bacterium]|nr:MAG: hypothetical protein DRP65_00035 [Planctomycetota bacterium]
MPGFYRPRSSNKYMKMSGRRGHSGGVPGRNYCPETGEEVLYSVCAQCSKYGVWEEGDLQRCRYEHDELKKAGFYSNNQDKWLEYLHDLDPKTWQELIEEKRNTERVLAEMEAEKSGAVAETEQEEPHAESNKEDEQVNPSDKGDEDEEDEDDDSDDWW